MKILNSTIHSVYTVGFCLRFKIKILASSDLSEKHIFYKKIR
jgi:hypothetical protein